MATTLDEEKSALLSEAAQQAPDERTDDRSQGAGPLVRAYYRNVAAEDVCERTVRDLYRALESHLELASQRPQGTARVRVLTPTQEQHGWSAGGHSVVQVVTDDMPFLVDSLTMELTRQGHDVRVVVHPQMDVVRDITGELKSVTGVEDGSVAVAEDAIRESWMQVEVSRVSDDEDVATLEEGLQRVLHDVRVAVEDWSKMNTQALQIVDELDPEGLPLPAAEVTQGQDLLRWLATDHFTFLGYREYRLEQEEGDEVLRAVPGTGLGILRFDQDMSTSFGKLPAAVKAKAHEKTLLVIAKANSRATVHRSTYLDYIGVKTFDEAGEVVGERRFLGLFSSAAYTESVIRIPLLREKAREVLKRAGFDPRSHAGKALLDTLENFPRDELFQTPVADLAPTAVAVMHARERRQLKVFIRKDAYDRYVSALVYLPRDRYNTSVREKFAQILKDGLGGETIEFSVRMGESATANVHFVVYPPRGEAIHDADTTELERRLAEASRSWREDFMSAAMSEFGDDRGARLAQQYVDSFPEAYKEDFSPAIGAADLALLEPLDDEGIDLRLYPRSDDRPMEGRLKVFRTGQHLSLSEMLPMISSTGVEVVDERPYELDGLGRPTFVYEFGLQYREPVEGDDPERFSEALRAIWEGRNEIDRFNRLVLEADLTWRQISVLRAYAKYMRQGHSPFAQDSIEEALVGNVEITRLLVRLFETRFDPAATDDAGTRAQRMTAVEDEVNQALDDVASLDHDRILRSYLTHIQATLRTNYFQTAADGAPHAYISLKMEPSAIPELPEPRPSYEIFVYSPRVEGVHLRFGAVARGGLRWSDRRDDFRTEVLGLVKAQMVKNTVIVPVGAKGGFFCKQLPDPGDRDAWQAEGISCYKTFISGLLDITDNLVEGETVPPEQVVRHDGDDSYLVVAADKGTATFSDIANGVAKDYGFWLGDAFASGGSAGYDHKAMGITARGAWVSVQRHFRERGIDCQREDFTAVGVGDMSGDVFGNGMLCSEHTRLVAAFDHRDIFLDPDPDTATSYAERKRLFEMPRSSWQDYDTDLISEGGGVYSRSMKSIPVNQAVRKALGLGDDVSRMTPAELMRAILLAPVDLLWNGGIGTYVKSADESNADAGDKANDAIRVNGRDLRVGCVGEGGNLGLTQLGRIEYAAGGGRINTDFIDNSAGVDTSDHEVNIKILLDRVVAGGHLDEEHRNSLLAEMTDEVADLVLRDNYEQNLALANAVAHAPSLLHVHEDWMKRLERRGVLNRDLEALPSSRQVQRRLDRGGSLTVPELSVLMSYTKIVLADELLESDLPDDPYLDIDLRAYFPEPVQEGYPEQIREHPLRRQIIVTQVVNDLVNGAGMTFAPRLAGETGASVAELTRANFVAREIFGSLPLRNELKSWDNELDAQVQTRMRIQMRTLVERASRWLVNNRRAPMDSQGTVDYFREPVQALMDRLPELMSGRELESLMSRRDALMEHDVPEELATRVASLDAAISLLGIVETAKRDERDPADVARVHFALGERLGLSVLMQRIFALPRDDRWQTMARAAIRDDLHAVHTQLTARVLDATPDSEPAPARIASWEDTDAVGLDRATSTLGEICADDTADLARLSVGLRVVRGLLSNG